MKWQLTGNSRALMIQGTGSHVGKSVLVAALCRILRQDGHDVVPFKAQNMALNSFITEDGKEMGRAQVVQAEAAGISPNVDMNPILIKPNTDVGAQIIIHGKVFSSMSARQYHLFKKDALKFVEESFRKLAEKYDFILIEGAGSPAEINLRENDIANMGIAQAADCPVVLVGDIDRGGVFASLVGTLELLDQDERERVKAFIINKFRGDLSLLEPGIDFLEKKTGVSVLGVVPYFKDIYIQEEDGVAMERMMTTKRTGGITIAIMHLPHISNFTDFDPLDREPQVNVRYVGRGESIEDVDVVVVPGSKNTIDDLNFLHQQGYVLEILRHYKRGGLIVGICGGYQMLGESISDPYNIESSLGSINGIGLLPVKTVIEGEKMTSQVRARVASGNKFFSADVDLAGYEIHMGRTQTLKESPMFEVNEREGVRESSTDGFISEDGRVWGTYIHGLFENNGFRQEFIKWTKLAGGSEFSDFSQKRESEPFDYNGFKELQYEKLASHVRSCLDMEAFYKIAGLR